MSGWGTIYQTTRLGLRRQTDALARLQQTVATGVQLRRASDGPSDAFHLLGLRDESKSIQTYRDNIERIDSSLSVASDALSQMAGLLLRTRELLTQGTSGTYSAGNRKPIAHEINALLEQVLFLANTRHGGRYLFGGSNIDAAPYEVRVENGRIVGVTYVGNRDALDTPVGPATTQPGALIGDAIFRGHERRPPVFLGDSGAAAGAGTSTVRTAVWLDLAHGTTTYLGASGIAAAASSPAGDTVLGNGHTLTIDALAGTLSLDGGEAVSFTLGDTDVCVTGADGDRVYVDTSALDPLFVGTVGLQATGLLSIDGGASTVPIDFADANLAVTDSATGRLLYVDCTGIERTGLEPVRVPGTADIFETLMTIRDLMLNSQGLPEHEQLQALNEMVPLVNEISDQVTLAETSVGSSMGMLATLDEALEDRQNHAEDQAAVIENADLVQVATELARRQTIYEMTLASASRLLRLTLFDYINF
jgi:flagellin-like hook-associated protein FlgL